MSLDGDTDTRLTAEQVEVNISADVLFAVDKADISSTADAALGRAVREFDSFPDGTLRVVGHTDDVGPDAHNQELSERRAQAVADRPPEEEPAVSNPSEGPTASGPEGVVLDGQQGQVRVTPDEVRRRDGLLVGEAAITQVSGEVSAVGEWFAVGGAGSHRGGFQPSLQFSPANLTLLAGGQRNVVMDHVRAGTEDSDDTWPLIDLTMSAPLPEGGTYVATAVWPDV